MYEKEPFPDFLTPESLEPEFLHFQTNAIASSIEKLLRKYHDEETIVLAEIDEEISSSVMQDIEVDLLDAYLDSMPDLTAMDDPLTELHKTNIGIQRLIRQATEVTRGYKLQSVDAGQFMISKIKTESSRVDETILHVKTDATKTDIYKLCLFIDPKTKEPRLDGMEPSKYEVIIASEFAAQLPNINKSLDNLVEQEPGTIITEINKYKTF